MSQQKPLSLPSIEDLEKIAENGKLNLTKAELLQYRDSMKDSIESYKKLDEIPDPVIPQRYPRSCGYRPTKENNPYNAWWYKSDIIGANTGKLHGKRIAIKDSILVAGVPMINGSYILEGYMPDEDAAVVTNILDEGGHIVGKSTCESLSYSGNSFTSDTGPVLNPYDKTRSSGGSSSGNAVLLHLGEVDMTVGTDQGGSIRMPSSWCGTVGLKPTFGLVPYSGIVSGEPTFDHAGPMTRNVKDCALLLEVIAGNDGSDFRQPKELKVPSYSQLLTDDIKGVKIAVLQEGFQDCEPDVVDIVKTSLNVFKKCGAIVQEVSIPEHKTNYNLLFGPLAAEGSFQTAMQNAGAIQGVKGHQNLGCIDNFRAGLLAKAHIMTPQQKLAYLFATYITENYGMHYYVKAQNLLSQLVQVYDHVLKDFNVIVMPTLPFKAPKLPDTESLTLKEYVSHCSGMTGNTRVFNITGHPALTVNAGFSEGLPIGLQIVGKQWDDATVLNVAYAFEQNLEL